MNTVQLKVFVSVTQTHNFTKTAKELYMTQPTVSNHIKALENSVGAKLFNRDTHTVTLTTEGKEYLDYADQILALQIAAENRLRNIARGRSGYIKIAMLSSTSKLFTECLAEYTKEQPNTQIDVFKLEGVEMTKAINRRNYDVYFANSYMMPVDESVRFFVTGTEQLHLYAHRDIAGKIDVEDWSTMQKLRFVSVSEMDFALSGQIRNLYSNRGIKPDTINYFNQADMLLLAVNSGIGVAILPPGLTYYYSFPNVVPIPISGEDAMINSVVAWHDEHQKAKPDVEDFLSISALRAYR